MSQPKSNEEMIQPILSKYDVKFMDGSTYGAAELFAKELLEALAQKDAELQKAREEERGKIEHVMSKRRAELLEDFDKDICEIGGFTQQAYNIAVSYLKHAMTLPRLQMRVDHSKLDQDKTHTCSPNDGFCKSGHSKGAGGHGGKIDQDNK